MQRVTLCASYPATHTCLVLEHGCTLQPRPASGAGRCAQAIVHRPSGPSPSQAAVSGPAGREAQCLQVTGWESGTEAGVHSSPRGAPLQPAHSVTCWSTNSAAIAASSLVTLHA